MASQLSQSAGPYHWMLNLRKYSKRSFGRLTMVQMAAGRLLLGYLHAYKDTATRVDKPAML